VITVVMSNDQGDRMILVGLTRTSIERLLNGCPLRLSAETQSGFPTDTTIYVVYSDTDRALIEDIRSVLPDDFKIVTMPGGKAGQPS